ncbi:hypothetical protein DCC81_12805 [Chitinophaga parva]|uniref:Uncharacterized protein n=1 Tax=Chitinophaga parva TaxID=2169414 RepID=A0A2T7BFX3_9BACT|nr:hypothetical protein DCC81_12805 [Chitinophaga parva]
MDNVYAALPPVQRKWIEPAIPGHPLVQNKWAQPAILRHILEQNKWAQPAILRHILVQNKQANLLYSVTPWCKTNRPTCYTPSHPGAKQAGQPAHFLLPRTG